MKLSVLDQSVAVAGRPQSDAIRDTLTLAEHAEALGYHRFSLASTTAIPVSSAVRLKC